MSSLVVATFNIRHGRGLDDVVSLERVAAVITATGADVVALQEVDRNLTRSGEVDQAAELAELTGLHISFWPTLLRGAGEYGLALTTRGPHAADLVDLPRHGANEPRGAVVADLGEVRTIATHLSRDRPERIAQLNALADLADGLDPPVVLLGDLNATRRHLVALETAGLFGDGSRHATLRGTRKQIDHVLAGRGARVTSSRTLDVAASDHRPLVATVVTA